MRRHWLRILALITALFSLPATAETPFSSDRIAVTVEGEGPDVILIPGLTSSPAAWSEVTPALPGYRWHFVQVKGFAGTAPEGNAQGDVLAGVAKEIARYIDEAGLDRPAVVGHSMGGTLALMIGARHPGAAGKVMVVDQLPFMGAVYGPPGTTVESVTPTADKLRDTMLARSPEEHEAQLAAMTAGMVKAEAKRAAVLESAVKSDRAVTAQAFHELIITDLGPELPNIAVPVKVLYVTPAGIPFTDEQIDGFYRLVYAPVKQVELVRIPDSAHFIMYDNPARFVEELKAFLGE